MHPSATRRRLVESFGAVLALGASLALVAPAAMADDVEVISAVDFDDGTTGAWQPSGTQSFDYVPDDDGGLALAVVDRSADYVGIQSPAGLFDGYAAGDVLTFSMQVRLAPGTPASQARFVMKPEYTWIGNTAVTADAWTTVTGTYTVPDGATGRQAYLGTGNGTATYTYYVDDLTVTAPGSGTPGENAATLDPLSDTVDFPLGVAIDQRETVGAAADVLTRHFDQITAENHMKPDAWYAADHTFTPSAQATTLMNFAAENDLRVYGHVLVWHSQTPDWFFQRDDGTPLTSSEADKEILRERMRTHIFSIAEYLSGTWGAFGSDTNPLVAWDVVNEVVDDGSATADGLRRSPWYQVLGAEYIDLAFTYADEAFNDVYADPSTDRPVSLFINDYNTESGGKQDRYFALVDSLIERGIPVDGVGHQMHLNLGVPISQLDATLDRFAALPVVQAVTELDVPTGTPVTQPGLIEQGYYYRDAFRVFREHSADLYSVTVWGLTDGRSWRDDSGAPLLFDDALQAKYAFWGAADGELPATPESADSFQADVALDADVAGDLAWRQLPTIAVGDTARFQTRWTADHLTVYVDVDDATVDASDAVALSVGDAELVVPRSGGDGSVPAVVTPRDGGYTVVLQAPLTGAAAGDVVDLDVRVTDGGETAGWNREGTLGALTLVGPLGYLEVAETAQEPVIDAVVDPQWAQADVVPTDLQIEGTGGASAQVRTLWREDTLYVLMDVTDPVIDSTGSNPWTRDSVEIYVDAGNSKAGAYTALDSQIRIGADGAVTFGTGDAAAQAARLTSAVATTGTGYVVEAAISLAGTGGAGTFHGLDFQVNDASGGERTGIRNWANPTGLGYQFTSQWGVGQLVEAPPVVVPDPSLTLSADRVRIAGSVRVDLADFTPGQRVTVRTTWAPAPWLTLVTARTTVVVGAEGTASTTVRGLPLLLLGPYEISAVVDGAKVASAPLVVSLR